MTAQIFNFEEEKKKRIISAAKVIFEGEEQSFLFAEIPNPENWDITDPLHPYNLDKE